MNVERAAEMMDRVVALDLAGRGIEGLYTAARERAGEPLCLAAARRLVAVPRGSVVLLTTGQASRAWITTRIAESDGPAGTAAVARALALGLDAIPVLLAEEELLPALGAIFTAAGLSSVTLQESRRTALTGGRLAVFVPRAFPTEHAQAEAAARPLLDEMQPAALFAAERAGRNDRGIYHNARGVDYGVGKARIDAVFAEAQRRGIPTAAVGDGGNELGMGAIGDAVRQHVRYGDRCLCGCGGGIGAATGCDALVVATCSNWGCYAVANCLALLLADAALLHTPEREELLLRRGVDLGLINSPAGVVDPNVDAIPLATHLAAVELLREIASRALIG